MIKGLSVLFAGAAMVGFSNWANAAATLTVYDGVNPLITVFDNGPGDQFPITGEILVQTNVGVWNLDINVAVTKPLFGSTTQPVMDLSASASSTAAGSLRLVFSDNGFGPATGTLNATETGHVDGGAPVNMTYNVYGDPANVVGATTVLIAGLGTTAFPTSEAASGLLALPTPFSLTQVVDFVAYGPTTISSDASFNVTVPEPGVLGFWGLGMVVCALARLQRRRA
jgi:hypothetical protein